MAYLGRLGRAFVNLMLWNLTGIVPLIVLVLPMHRAHYHYVVRGKDTLHTGRGGGPAALDQARAGAMSDWPGCPLTRPA
jgi:hypothetical protein